MIEHWKALILLVKAQRESIKSEVAVFVLEVPYFLMDRCDGALDLVQARERCLLVFPIDRRKRGVERKCFVIRSP